MTRLVCFGLGVAIGVLALLLLSYWADERDRRFGERPSWSKGG